MKCFVIYSFLFSIFNALHYTLYMKYTIYVHRKKKTYIDEEGFWRANWMIRNHRFEYSLPRLKVSLKHSDELQQQVMSSISITYVMFKFFQDCVKITSLAFVTLVFILPRKQKQQQQKKSVNTINIREGVHFGLENWKQKKRIFWLPYLDYL